MTPTRTLIGLAMAVAALPVVVAAQPAAPSSAPAATPVSDAVLRHAVDSIAAQARRFPVEGLTIAVARDGELVLERGYGLADVATRRAADAGTVWEIGSTTKQFTAAAILRLAEAGRLRLDDEVATYFPALAERGRGVTLRHLLNHTSGLSAAPVFTDFAAQVDPATVVDTLAARPADSAPGERFRYNNSGYVLLGLVVERVSRTPWSEYLHREFLRPLGLRATRVCGTGDGLTATGYTHDLRDGGRPVAVPLPHPSTSYAAGALCSTAADLLRWQHALASGRVVSAESYGQMTTPTTLASGRQVPYGLGLYVMEQEGRPHVHHGGATPGAVAQLGLFPEDGLGVVVLTNGIYAPSLVEQVEGDVMRAALGLPRTVTPDLALNAVELARYTGRYELQGMPIEVFVQGRHLRVAPRGQVAARLLHQGDGVFVAEHDPRMQVRFRVEGGRAAEMMMERGGRAMPPATRVE